MRRLLQVVICVALLTLGARGVWAQTTALQAVESAHRETLRLREPAQRALALADVAAGWHRLGDERAMPTLAEAVAAAELVEEALARPTTWRGLAVRSRAMAPEQSAELQARAIKAAAALPYAAHRALVLREVGRGIADVAQASELMAQSAAAARLIETPVFRAAALRDTALALAATDREAAAALFKEAAEAVVAIPAADETAELAMQELVVAWALVDLPAALKDAGDLVEERLREVTYRRMCQALAPVSPDDALQVVAKLHDAGQRALAMAAVAAHLPPAQAEVAAAMGRAALVLGAHLPVEDKPVLQADAAVAIAAVDPGAALAMLTKVEDEQVAGRAVGRIALMLARAKASEARQLLDGIEDFEVRENYQMKLAPLVAGQAPALAMELAEGLLSRWHKVQALLAIAEQLAGSK